MHGANMKKVAWGYLNEVCSLLKTGDMWALQVGGITVGTCVEWPTFSVAEQFAVSTCEEWPSFVVELVAKPKSKARPASKEPAVEAQPPTKRTGVPTAAKSGMPNKIARQNEQAAPLGQPTSADIQVLYK